MEAWVSQAFLDDNLDSLVYWPKNQWVITTAKGTHDLVVFAARRGELVTRFGQAGSGAGQFLRPNGIAVSDNLLFVVERDNHRVQVLRLPEFQPLGTFGEDILRKPYGIALYLSEEDRYEVFISDNYETPGGNIPPVSRLGERVKHFQLDLHGMGIEARFVRSFGETQGEGILHKVESLAVDSLYDRVLIAEELQTEMAIKIYTPEGEFTGRILGRQIFKFEPEGIALYTEGDGGFWVFTDQEENRTIFHVFGRVDLDYLGSFSGEKAANTDGICITDLPFPGFPRGALFAVHDDRQVAAFSWERILAGMKLSQ